MVDSLLCPRFLPPIQTSTLKKLKKRSTLIFSLLKLKITAVLLFSAVPLLLFSYAGRILIRKKKRLQNLNDWHQHSMGSSRATSNIRFSNFLSKSSNRFSRMQ